MLKVLGVIFIVAYCFTIDIFYTVKVNSSNKTMLENNQTSAFTSVISSPISHQSKAEGSIQTYCPPLPNFKNQSNNFSLLLKSTEELTVNTFSQYTSFSINFLYRFRKVDIIFPFHYFW